ncbi:YkgJ family cysteine cluster protein [Marinomonas epiphytica]
MHCRKLCGACCIAPSITSAIPGMPNGKPAGIRCVQLLDDARCAIFGDPRRPAVCHDFTPEEAICGDTFEQAVEIISSIENITTPSIRKSK